MLPTASASPRYAGCRADYSAILLERRLRDALTQVNRDLPTATFDNAFRMLNRYTVVENMHWRQSDIVLFVNGLLFGLIVLKNPASEDATTWAACQWFQTYEADLLSRTAMNTASIVSDRVEAPIGTLTARQSGCLGT